MGEAHRQSLGGQRKVMPYIKQEDRQFLHEDFPKARTPGELNYLITSACLEYLAYQKKDYQHYNDVIGALEACKLEFYRRAVAPYEEEAIKRNGDIY